jgi:hypothetical protein
MASPLKVINLMFSENLLCIGSEMHEAVGLFPQKVLKLGVIIGVVYWEFGK